MGISLGDLGSFAVGAIKQDEKNTAEKLVDRRAELEADRAGHIKMKEQKYDRELKAYDVENKKLQSIKSVNAEFKGKGEINPAAYGERYLSETNPTLLLEYKKMYIDEPNKLNTWLAGYANDGIKNYTTTNTEESLQTNRKESIDEITATYKKKLEAARGDSFLIGKLIGDRKNAIAEVDTKNIESTKGIELVNEINNTTKETNDLGFTFGKLKLDAESNALNWKLFKKRNPKYVEQFNKLDGELVYKSLSQNNNFLNFMKTSQILGTNTEAQFKLKNSDTEIEGLNPSAQSIISTYKSIYDEVKKNFSAQNFAANGVDETELRNFMSTEAINKAVQNIMIERSVVMKDFVAFIPVSVFNEAGEILVKGQAISKGGKGIMKPDIGTMKQLYVDFLQQESQNITTKYKKDKGFNKLNAVQSSIETGGIFKAKFLEYVSDKMGISSPKDNPETPENESIINAPKVIADRQALEVEMKKQGSGNSIIKLDEQGKVVPQTEGKYGTDETRITLDPFNNGFKQGGKFVKWENLEKRNMIDKLPNFLKLRYNTWKSKQSNPSNRTIKDFNNNTIIDNDMVFSSMIEDIEKDFKSKKKYK